MTFDKMIDEDRRDDRNLEDYGNYYSGHQYYNEKCVWCESDNLNDEAVLYAEAGIMVVKCDDCGLIHGADMRNNGRIVFAK